MCILQKCLKCFLSIPGFLWLSCVVLILFILRGRIHFDPAQLRVPPDVVGRGSSNPHTGDLHRSLHSVEEVRKSALHVAKKSRVPKMPAKFGFVYQNMSRSLNVPE